MVDRNMQDFHVRLGRIEKIHDAGGGFEAEGALGMSYYNAQRRPARRPSLLGPLVLVLMAVVAIKATVHASIGAERYGERIATLQAGDTADRVGAYILQAEPLTLAISGQISKLIY